MNFKKRLLALILPVLMVASMSMSAFAQEAKSSTFTDVPEGSYYAEAVATVSELGLMTGMSEGVFGPTKTLSRAMVATVLYRLGGEQEPEKPGSEYFTDVAAGSFYDKPVGWCYEKGITTGYGNGTFLPARNITREEYATFMYRMVLKLYPDQVYEGCDGTPDATTAQDWSDAHDYSQKALSWAVDAGIIKGMNNSETDMIIKPRGNISRADTAVMMSRLLTYLEDTANNSAVTILYTNDVHTYIDGAMSYATIGQMKKDLETAGKNVLLVDAGDHIQGTAYGAMDEGETIRQLMAEAGYDLATLGNHEFDYGMSIALKTATENTVPYVSCNFKEDLDLDGEWENVLNSYEIFEFEDYTVGIVGITTPESISKSTPAYFMNEDGEWVYSIDTQEGQDLYEDVQAAVDAVIEEGADVVIAIGHLGDDYSASPWTSEETIANTTGIDAFIDGHSHSTVENRIVQNKDGEDVVLTQTGSYYKAIGEMFIEADGTINTRLVKSYYAEDEEIAAIEDEWMADVDTQLGKTIAETEIEFTVAGEDGSRAVRKYETNLADLDADAYYYYINEVAGLDCDLTFTNGGGVRATIPAGEWTYKTAKTVNPFGNVLCLMEVNGQQILDALEFGSRLTPDVECGGFLHGAGVTYKVDTTVENTVQIDSANIWTGSPTGDYRVYDVKIYNKETAAYEPLDVNKKYKLGGINYTLRRQGDGFNMFRADLGMNLIMEGISVDYMAMSTYLQAFTDTDGNGIANIATANSPLNKYANFLIDYENPKGAGRTVITTGEPEEPEVWDQKVIIGGTELNVWFTKYGNTYCDCTVEHFMGTDDNGFGFEYGDLVEINLNGQTIVAPVVSNYSDVDSGATCIRIADGASYVEMAINMGNFGKTYGLVNIVKDSATNTYTITPQDGVTFPVDVTFTLKEKGGYLAEMLLHQLTRTNNRTDYPALSDAEFANVRKINTNGMGDYLYRGSSPINPEIGRNTYADAEIQKRGVSVIMNLADNDTTAAGYAGFAESYYSKQQVIYLNLGVDVTSAEFKAGFANGLKFFAENEGTYYVHCTEGKDRAGFASAFLECFMGATADEVIADYMVTYYNYYGVEPGTDKYNAIANSNIVKTLQNVFGVADIKTADLAAEATEYMKEAGLTDTEIANLRANLARRMVF